MLRESVPLLLMEVSGFIVRGRSDEVNEKRGKKAQRNRKIKENGLHAGKHPRKRAEELKKAAVSGQTLGAVY
jgi:hypothetical protein